MSRSSRRRQTILPESVRNFLRCRLMEVCGLLFWLGGVFLLLTFATYDRMDPSLNTAIDGPTNNWMGPYGAYTVDVAFHFIGYAAYFYVLVAFAWGRLYLGHQHIPNLLLKSFLSIPCVLGLSILFQIMPHFDEPYLSVGYGGVFGHITNQYIFYILNFPFAGGGVSMFLCILIFPLGYYVLSLPRNDWSAILKVVHTSLLFLHNFWKEIVKKLLKIKRPTSSNGKSAPPPKVVKEKTGTKPKKSSKPPLVETIPSHSEDKSEGVAYFDLKSHANFQLPALNLLTPAENEEIIKPDDGLYQQNANQLHQVLNDFGVRGEIAKVRPGPVVTLYELIPAAGIKSSRVIGLADDIARSMAAVSARVAVIPGQNAIGIELPNDTRTVVNFREILETKTYEKSHYGLALALGKDIGGKPVIVDLSRMPHLLVAGTTGSGKSVAINTMILSLIYRLSPEQCRLIMIDPKMLELSVYDGIPHLLTPVVTDPKKAVVTLKWAVQEMENRYRGMSKLGVRNIVSYNQRVQQAKDKGEELTRRVQTGFDPETGQPIFETQPLELEPLPYIVIIVDEMADLMMVAGKDIESAVQRLAQMARAAGIHLVMATQRPSVDVITGTIKANFPTRISFYVSSKIDSRTILGEQGAEQLLGQGDMLYLSTGGRVMRVHGPFVSDAEVEKVVDELKAQGEPDYIQDIMTYQNNPLADGDEPNDHDDLYTEAVGVVRRSRKASTSFIQRNLKIGYNRAARIMEQMETDGLVGPSNHVGKREIFLSEDDS